MFTLHHQQQQSMLLMRKVYCILLFTLLYLSFSYGQVNITTLTSNCYVSLEGKDTQTCGSSILNFCASPSQCIDNFVNKTTLWNDTNTPVLNVIYAPGFYSGSKYCGLKVQAPVGFSALNGGDVMIYCFTTSQQIDYSFNSTYFKGFVPDIQVTGIAFHNGFSPNKGGCISVEASFLFGNSINVVFNGCNFTSCFSDSLGGAISNFGGVASIQVFNCNFRNNSGVYGGAIYVNASYSQEILNSQFISNTAFQGGAIYQSGGLFLEVQSGTFIGNFAKFGGAVYLNETMGVYSSMNMTSNSAIYGGAVFIVCYNNVMNGNIDFISATIQSNTATLSGGGIFTNCPHFVAIDGTLSSNIAATGGGFYIASLSGSIGNFDLGDMQISENLAAGGQGNQIYFEYAQSYWPITNGYISGYSLNSDIQCAGEPCQTPCEVLAPFDGCVLYSTYYSSLESSSLTYCFNTIAPLCQNDGKCVSEYGYLNCVCESGFAGTVCQNNTSNGNSGTEIDKIKNFLDKSLVGPITLKDLLIGAGALFFAAGVIFSIAYIRKMHPGYKTLK
eukprot:TRINITY_DN6623_c0_g1_i2.p1 TRINITY_DN6623_c0_g1~~TRINITY_DN6623_c0_g1_i2.p1  ORF type:complete len:557 (+),score=75.54 TRINITY_DN6623_c0_g1_i2:160-1830(+)